MKTTVNQLHYNSVNYIPVIRKTSIQFYVYLNFMFCSYDNHIATHRNAPARLSLRNSAIITEVFLRARCIEWEFMTHLLFYGVILHCKPAFFNVAVVSSIKLVYSAQYFIIFSLRNKMSLLF